jgi:hypothetical protein
MPRNDKNLWPDRRRDAFHVAERLVTDTATKLPTDLGAIAAKRRIRRIEFKPLLTDGSLAVDTEGFVIYVNCSPGDGADLTDRFSQDGTGSTLPRSLLHRARFTIAHEIAHTLFYDLGASPPKEKIPLNHSNSVKSLEFSCNEIAGVLTMPELLIEREFRESGFLLPAELRELAGRSLVSSQALVRRFQDLRRLPHPEAIIVSATRSQTEWSIAAISRHYSLRHLFPEARLGTPLRSLITDPDFVLYGGERSEVSQRFLGHRGTSVMHVVGEQRNRVKRPNDALITLRPIHAS